MNEYFALMTSKRCNYFDFCDMAVPQKVTKNKSKTFINHWPAQDKLQAKMKIWQKLRIFMSGEI